MASQNPVAQIIAHAEAQPEQVALFSNRMQMSYATFLDTVKRVAAKLRGAGVRPGNVVGLKLDPEIQAVFIAAVLHEAAVSFAATKNIIESYAQDIDFVISSTRDWQSTAKNLIVIDSDWLASLASINKKVEPRLFDSQDSLALLVFSSGTTGVPKGVEFTVADVHRRTEAAANNWMPVAPFFSELGLDTVSGIQTYYYALFNGATYFVPINATEDVRLISAAAIGSIKTSPAKLAELSEAAKSSGVRLDSLKQVQVAGGLLSPAVAAALAEVSNAQLIYLYGSTEAGTVTRSPYDAGDPESVGEVVADAEVQITDSNGVAVPTGIAGELRMRTSYMARRYWRAADHLATDDLAAASVPASIAAGFNDGWFLPGDTGVLEEGNRLRITGRVDELINAAGIKLNPALIESKLAGYRGILDLAAFGYNVPGDIHKRLGVAIVTAQEISLERFRQHVLDTVAETSDILIVRVAEIPRNALGKPLRKVLAAGLDSISSDKAALD